MKFEHTSGGFTLPGESGQEKLTLELAKKSGSGRCRDKKPMKSPPPWGRVAAGRVRGGFAEMTRLWVVMARSAFISHLR